MLDPEDRRLYSQCFAAPEGFVFDCAVGTTYSLDLESLLFAQFCIATGGAGEPDSALKDPVGLLEAIHRTARRVTVFCHAGETNAPSQPHSLYALLEKSIVPARGKAGGAIFHPKLWVLRFKRRETGEAWLRVVVLSRNLTSSRAWDSFLSLEAEPERGRKAESAQLAALLLALPELALGTVDAERREQLELLAGEIHRTEFPAPTPFEGVAEFFTTGFGQQAGFSPTETGEKVLAISPFVSNAALRSLRALAPHGQLIGRAEEMARCKPETVGAWDAFALDDAASSDADTADLEEGANTADAAPQGLHVKALAIQGSRRTTWWFGSGNLTDPVQAGTSVEVMIRLVGKTAQVGIERFLAAGFEELLTPYVHAPPPLDPQEGSRSLVEEAKELLARAPLQLRCQPRGDAWSLVLSGLPELEDAVGASCRPVTLSEGYSLRLVPGSVGFEGVTMEALTALICFQLSAGKGDASYTVDLTLKLPIEGLPEARDARISRSIIKDRASFLRYLQCLLGGVGDSASPASAESALGGSAARGGSSPFASGLLEQLLKALHQEPERLRGLRSLLTRVGEVGQSEETVVPDEFRELWTVIEPFLPEGDGP